jgi:exosortase B
MTIDLKATMKPVAGHPSSGSSTSALAAWMPWLPVLLGGLVLVLPTYARMWASIWDTEAYEHGPMMIAIVAWLIWREREALAKLPYKPALLSGGLLLCTALFIYFIGRVINLPLLELGAQVVILPALVLLALGWAAVRKLWFALGFMVFAVPLPGFVLVAMTSQLKQWVSVIAESLLYQAGYPIARDGVVITIGQYPMLVADACSGLNSLYTLSAVGLLYVYLTYAPGWLRNTLLLAAIVPMAILANIVRVMLLILLTYHQGYDAGQGFMHGLSGILLFIVALMGLMLMDQLMRKAGALGRRSGGAQALSAG